MTRNKYFLAKLVGPYVPCAVRRIRGTGLSASAVLSANALILVSTLLFAVPVSAANSPVTSADSANFTLNTTDSSEGGTQSQSDSGNFVLNSTGGGGIQADSGDFTVNTMLPVVAFRLLNPSALPGGLFRFSFTNLPGAGFHVYGTTNLAVPFGNWILLGALTDNPPGQFQFTDSQMTNYPRRFYRVISP
jgi:hypothetical protein